MNLVRYDAACRAVAEVKSIDEAKDLRDKAEGMRAYAHQANNRQLEIDAAEIRMRAERRLGELMRVQREAGGVNRGAMGNPGGRGAAIVRDENGPAQPTLAEVGIDKHLADRARKMAAMPEERFEEALGEWREATESTGIVATSSLLDSRAEKHGIHYSSETAEHYTPKSILDAVVACMGAIDLDPCSNPGKANVPARTRYRPPDDGLSKTWRGRVFMNPPYGKDIRLWVEKLRAEHVEARTVTQAIALVPSRTDTEWFRMLRDYPVCFIAGRLTFVGNADPAPFPSAVFYLGDGLGSFTSAFGSLGDIWTRIR